MSTEFTRPIEGLPAPATRDGQPTSLLFVLAALAAVVAVLGVGLLSYDAPLPLMMVVGFCVALVAAALRGVPHRAAEGRHSTWSVAGCSRC